jgi:hypothetical protein
LGFQPVQSSLVWLRITLVFFQECDTPESILDSDPAAVILLFGKAAAGDFLENGIVRVDTAFREQYSDPDNSFEFDLFFLVFFLY